RDAEQAGFPEEALTLAKRADRAAPDFAPAALARAALDRVQGNARRARRQLERAFGRNPHPEIAQALLGFAESAESNDTKGKDAEGGAADGAGETALHDRLRIAQRLLEI